MSVSLQYLTDALKKTDGVDCPRLEAEWILQSGRSDIEEILERRRKKEPLSKILQSRGFWAYDFKVTKDTLDPRPDSETLIEAVLHQFLDKKAPLRILDLGTGTGCLLLTLLKEYPQSTGLGVDKSLDALRVAFENAVSLGVSSRAFFAQGDWFENGWTEKLKESGFDPKKIDLLREKSKKREKKEALFPFFPVDMIISNPPYIPTKEIDFLQEEVSKYDPRLALDGGKDGLSSYRRLAETVHSLLKTSGRIFFEIGQGQEEQVTSLMQKNGFAFQTAYKDLGGIPRCLVFRST